MLLNRKPLDRYESDRRQADASLKAQVDFIVSNIHRLSQNGKEGRMRVAVMDFRDKLRRGEEFTPGQRAYAEGIYEQIMKAAGYDSVNVHHDKRRKGLKFG